MGKKVEAIRVQTFIPAQDVEDAPYISNKAELMAEISQIENAGNRVVLTDDQGFEIPLHQVVSLEFPE